MRIGNVWHIVVSIMLILHLASDVDRGKEVAFTARTIIEKMASQYSTAMSYQDSGLVETTFLSATGSRLEELPFNTYFRRPRFFRFEWIEALPTPTKHVIWCDGRHAYKYRDPDIFEDEEKLSLAISGASGLTSGASHTIPRLLIDEMVGFVLTDLTNLSLEGSDVFEGQECFVIKGIHPMGDTNELWIGKTDFLLRKLKTVHKFADFSAISQEIHRNIRLNEEIPVEIFDFKLPISLKRASSER
jgi:hypothetical protein